VEIFYRCILMVKKEEEGVKGWLLRGERQGYLPQNAPAPQCVGLRPNPHLNLRPQAGPSVHFAYGKPLGTFGVLGPSGRPWRKLGITDSVIRTGQEQ
jgi:hypothetical protein